MKDKLGFIIRVIILMGLLLAVYAKAPTVIGGKLTAASRVLLEKGGLLPPAFRLPDDSGCDQ